MSTLVRWPLQVKIKFAEGESAPFPAYEDSTELYSEESWQRIKETSLDPLPAGFFGCNFPRDIACNFFQTINERRDFIRSVENFEVELEVEKECVLDFPKRIRDIRYAKSALSGRRDAPFIENRCIISDLIPLELLRIAKMAATGNSDKIVTKRGGDLFH